MKDISEVQLVMMDSADPKAQAEASARLEKLFEELKQAPTGPAKPAAPKQRGKVTPAPAKAEGWTNPLASASNEGDWDGWDQGEPAWTEETPALAPAPKKQGWDDWGEGDEDDVFEVPTGTPAAAPANDSSKKPATWDSKDDNWDKW